MDRKGRTACGRIGGKSLKTTVEVKIPEGETCLTEKMKPCILARYTKKWGAYNCQLYNRILKGEKVPKKCRECRERCGAGDKQ